MTRNLFLLFVRYFFVVQAFIVGVLTGDTLYYKLGAINALAIILISICYHFFTAPIDPSAKKADKKELPVEKEEKKADKKELDQPKPTQPLLNGTNKIVQTFTPPPKRRKRRGSFWAQIGIFMLTLLFALSVHFISREFLTYRSPVIAVVIGFILFLLIGNIFEVRGFHQIRKLFTARIYYLLLLAAGSYTGLYLYGKGELVEHYLPPLRQFPFSSTSGTIDETSNTPDNVPSLSGNLNGYIFEETGTVLSGFQGTTEKSDNEPTGTSGAINITTGTSTPLSGTTTQTGTATEPKSGTNLPSPSTTTEATTKPAEAKPVLMIDALKHVIERNAIPLSSKTDITFSFVSKTHTNYPYFKTAYEKRMIGKNTDPSKQISCETYMVIKGLGEGRDVGSYTDVKVAYWKKAESLGKLNGCTKGGRVSTATW